MAEIAIVTSQVPGNANSSIELGRRLRAAGHRAEVLSPFDLEDASLNTSLDVTTFAPGFFVGRATRATGEQASPGSLSSRIAALVKRLSLMRGNRARTRAKVSQWKLEGFVSLPQIARADLVLIDQELSLHIIACAGRSINVAVLTPHFPLFKRPGLPPLHSSTVPTRPGSRSLRLESEWAVFRVREWLRARRLRMTRMGEDSISVIEETARQFGFDVRSDISFHDWFRPAVFPNHPQLSMTLPEMDLPHPAHPATRYIGPMVRPVLTEGWEIERLRQIVRHAREAGSRLVYCSFGTWHGGDDADVYRTVIEAARSLDAVELIVGLGGRMSLDGTHTDKGIHVFEFAPQLEVIRESDLAIGHGGINTVNECITAAVPMLLLPFDTLDRRGTAARVAFHGLGRVRERSPRPTAADIAADIAELLDGSEARRRCQSMATALQRYESEGAGLRVIEELLDH